MTVPARADLAALPELTVPRRAPGAVLLNSNEHPAPPPAPVLAALAEAATRGNRYPDWTSEAVVDAIAARCGVHPERVAVGCGSTALCQQIVQAYCGPGDEVLHAWRSFEAYPVFARIAGATPVAVPLADHRHDLPAMAAAVTAATRVVFVCDPNNPTGAVVDPGELTRFLDAVPPTVLVVIDEAYREFDTGPADALPHVARRGNVAVLRTLSKAYGLAGIRIGYCVAPPDVIRAVGKVAIPFAVSGLAQAAAVAALGIADDLTARCRDVSAERDRLRAALLARGFTVPRSQANFLWLPLGDRAADFGAHCADHGVLVRVFAGDGARVTVGDRADNHAFLAAADRFAG